MVSDDDIVSRLNEILNTADLTVTTTSAIRRQLEEELAVDLSEKKVFIRHHVDLYLARHQQRMQQQMDEAGVKVEEEARDDGEEQGADDNDSHEEREEKEEEEEEEEEDEEKEQEEEKDEQPEPDSKRFQAKIERVKRDSLQKEKKKRSGGGGLSKLCALSPELQVVIGVKELPRTQVVKQLWEYIREKNLQDPDNRRKIICDKALRAVIGSNTTDIFKMNKLLSKHIWPLDSLTEEGEPKPKKHKTEKKEDLEKEKGGKGRGGGFTAPLPLSEAMINFLGTGESELSRANVVKRIWDYIKSNQLQDPSNKRQIVCDTKLQGLFGCDTFVGFTMSKHLTAHFKKS